MTTVKPMKPINFAKGPVYCIDCGARMRPTRHNFGAWPRKSVPYGARGRCEICVASEPTAQPTTVVLGEAPTAPTPAATASQASAADESASAPTPQAMPRRPRRRFDYTPPAMSLCPSCGRPIDPRTGECLCSI